jgi:hypothetical protein
VHLLCFLIIVSIDELDIDLIDRFQIGMVALHPKPEGDEPEC